ncbi:MAG: hypothetical protein NTX20_06140 [Verrucomicrobia bacterium]|nr:hypothetical protein [Verrucomicrobiota bacterium]NBY37201.1 hypothetical protein [Verrucomicrobiota bacterium]
MKIKYSLLLALLATAGLIAADAPKPEGKPDAPKKGEGKKGPSKPESVSDADWKKFLDASKAAQSDAAVVAAKAKAKDAKSEDEKKEAGKAVMEATKAAVLKADASLESVFKALEEAHGKGKKKK